LFIFGFLQSRLPSGGYEMRYLGSKARLAKHLIPVILSEHDDTKWYIEPFVGAFNIMDKVPARFRWGNDLNHYVTSLYSAVLEGWEPPGFVSEELYLEIKRDPDAFPAKLVGFVGFGCSFAGKWFGGYARGGTNKLGEPVNYAGQSKRSVERQVFGVPRNHAGESKRNVIKQALNLMDVKITSMSYDEMVIPIGSTVYCDPPYAKTTKYRDVFDSQKFWEWVRQVSQTSTVYVSEYTAPNDFTCVWEKETTVSVAKHDYKKNVERLWKRKEFT
jgi:DNA adenine methylase